MESSTEHQHVHYQNVTETPYDGSSSLLAVMGMLSFFSVIGITGNLLVLYVYLRKRHKVASTVFIISLAATDFMTCLVVVPYTIVIEYFRYFVQYDVLCKLYMFLITSNVPFAAFIMVAIAIDRYLCIVHPFKHLMNAKRAKRVSLSLATFAFVLGVLTSLNYGVYQRGVCFRQDNEAINSTCEILARQDNSSRINYYPKYTGICEPTELIFSRTFTNSYQKIYFGLFIISFITVLILYCLVYRSVLIRRARRRRQRNSSGSLTYTRESWFSENKASVVLNYGSAKIVKDHENNNDQVQLARQMTIRERGLVANIRTAAMLFVVTTVFIIAFLPAWLMAHELVSYNIIIFYMYFLYNVANPMIYAFMNKAFRRDLKEVFDCHTLQSEML
ncbi:hypothetical protein FSP39_006263 [Pinctada imbricata]|uniref:G-protein coupled receptors family 1 profile domain-containing protein n=1 Tax=Pinctada imbricata TaxID=66713 RepID=A0AA89C7W7_PINIB|nr:hypothetical protein FSP39_006263 [Pinctada imbricata]